MRIDSERGTVIKDGTEPMTEKEIIKQRSANTQVKEEE